MAYQNHTPVRRSAQVDTRQPGEDLLSHVRRLREYAANEESFSVDRRGATNHKRAAITRMADNQRARLAGRRRPTVESA